MPKLTKEDFVQRSRGVHGKKYDYSQSVFMGVEHPVVIICPVHGPFTLRPRAHYTDKRGCENCDTSGKSGFSSNTKWARGELTFYFVELMSEHELFLKIGVTSESTVEVRFSKGQIPYEHVVIDLFKFKEAKAFEERLKSIVKVNKWGFQPLKKFRGGSVQKSV
jgi:hypothetical protein